jgi:hypothetical protein
MNILKNLRKPYFSMFLSVLILFVSCEKYNSTASEEQTFDYSLFKEFQTSNIELDLGNIQNKKTSSEYQFSALIDLVNSKLDTDLELPNNALKMINQDAETIFEQSINNGWTTQEEVELANNLITEIKDLGFDNAISNYEQNILNQNLSKEDFAKQNKIVNILKSQNYNNPDLYNLQSKGGEGFANKGWCDWCKCAAASVAFVVATGNMTSCLTVVACGLAIVLMYAASNSFASQCLE